MESFFEGRGQEESFQRQWCVVYDIESNDIVHTYESITILSNTPITDRDLANAALASLSSYFDRERVAVAHPEPDAELNPGMTYTVDPKSATVRSEQSNETLRLPRPAGGN